MRLEPTNLAYVQPHRIEINGYTFLFLNGKDVFYINSFCKINVKLWSFI